MGEIRNALSLLVGGDLNLSKLRVLFNDENRDMTVRILLDSIDLGRIEHVCSTFYVTVVACLAAGLSENAAKFGLSLNVSSMVSHSLHRVIRPLIPETQPLLRFFARAACASVGIMAAFRLEKSLLVWANRLFGAELIVNALTDSFKKGQQTDQIANPSMERLRTTCIWAIAGSGLVFQVLPGNEMPFWVKGVLVGPRMFEYGLQALSLSLKGSENRAFFV